MLSVVENLNSQ